MYITHTYTHTLTTVYISHLPVRTHSLTHIWMLYCEPLSRCRRNRAITPGESPYTVVADSISIEDTGCTMDILNTKNNVLLTAEVSTLEDSMFRLKIKEKAPLRPRYEVEGALVGEPKRERWRKVLCWFTFCEHALHLWSLWCTTHGQNYVLGMYQCMYVNCTVLMLGERQCLWFEQWLTRSEYISFCSKVVNEQIPHTCIKWYIIIVRLKDSNYTVHIYWF